SVGEVFTHITAADCGIAGARGTAPPAGIDLKAITGLFADKPKVLQAMKDSFGHFRNAIVALNDADADKPQKMFNRQTTLRGSFLMITGHFGEHLAQSIAHARVNGIVPGRKRRSSSKSLRKNEAVGPWRIERSVSYTF